LWSGELRNVSSKQAITFVVQPSRLVADLSGQFPQAVQ
jgi:hypothetical protein